MLSRFAASLAAGEISEALKRLRMAALLSLLAGLALLCGLGFLIAGAFVIASERWGAVAAAFGFALGFLVLAAAIYGLERFLLRRRIRQAERRRMSDARLLAGTAALSLLPSILARRGGAGALLMPLVALAGYAIYRENSRGEADGREDRQE